MPQWDESTLTERQRKWFASLREGLERDTGRSLVEWAELARICPETRHRARLKWLKDAYGLGQNHGSQVLAAGFPSEAPDNEDPLWAAPAERAIFDAVQAVVEALPETLTGRRKGYTSFSRKLQFAAIRPAKGSGAVLGLALAPDASPRLSATKREPWSERLKSAVELRTPAEIDADISPLLRRAWELS